MNKSKGLKMTAQRYNIYKMYNEKYTQPSLVPYDAPAYPKYVGKVMVNRFLMGLTFGLVNKKFYCPRCAKQVDEFTYENHPIYTYGCTSCRILKAKMIKTGKVFNMQKADNKG